MRTKISEGKRLRELSNSPQRDDNDEGKAENISGKTGKVKEMEMWREKEDDEW